MADLKTKIITGVATLVATGSLYVMSPSGMDRLEYFEGNKLTSYQDTGGIYTIGVGHTGPEVKKNMTITASQSKEYLKQDLRKSSAVIEKYVKKPITSQNQVDALMDFIHNLGSGSFATSTLLKKINSGDCVGAGNEFLKWNKLKVYDKISNSYVLKVSKWQTERRQWERGQWLMGCEK